MRFFTTVAFPARAPRHVAAFAALACALNAVAAPAPAADAQAAQLSQIREAAMGSDWAYQRLSDMTDLIGPRLSGSPGAAAAVEQVATAMRALGARVTLQPVTVPHWVRGVETGELVEYAGRPAGVSQRVVLTALGGSGATAAAGLRAPVLVVRGFEELKARAAEVKGRIVLFDVAFDKGMAERGQASAAYGGVVPFRVLGPKLAAEMGAAAALVRSVGSADFRLPHTGASALSEALRIPAAAVSVEDAMLISRLAARGPVQMLLTLTPQNLPDVDSYNVIADLPGSDKADEVVLVSGHLDSWDLATGANDDGAGVASAMAVIETLKRLKLQPRRTIRMVAWMNEENGGRGGRAYFDAHRADLARHVAAIESDSGSGRPFGIMASVGPGMDKLFAPLQTALQPIGAHAFSRRDALSTGDLFALETGGVPSFEPIVDGHDYFYYHHSAADTLDKVDPDNLRRHVALLSTLSWYLANMTQPIGRAPAQQ
ncbi:MAG: M20/M25/M40 family metallo-hydrolase [Pseudomonadota bacterium]